MEVFCGWVRHASREPPLLTISLLQATPTTPMIGALPATIVYKDIFLRLRRPKRLKLTQHMSSSTA
ncbi:uncharacterized protein PHALS_14827 [Plasmopara halstedii]|uniref:Uncharacterized protein n=1 Tax=Plasmopara halstedii TaxID=4781 RepID=A0A0P1A5R5_PLAHL|nr:uncharacterized protein PHALS_14827 [Plasmopara halstedii]CEG35874.1 hypothetical protein PHALS_14827 [Plasmopara halstedii]|eukprot:XP_024572243.1 hypothetical protein PHALS_14827 [Plasmopara halstedii]